jgi:hypothetical protein
MTVSDLSAELTWDAAPAGTVEYAWGVQIDTDGDPSTGDPSGLDAKAQLEHVSAGPPSSHGLLKDSYATSDEIVAQSFWVREYYWDDTASQWKELAGQVLCSIRGNTIGLSFTGGLRSGSLSSFYGLYYPSPAGPEVNDTTSVVTGASSTTDAAGDAGGYSFIDVTSAQAKYYGVTP